MSATSIARRRGQDSKDRPNRHVFEEGHAQCETSRTAVPPVGADSIRSDVGLGHGQIA
jgi:hypothetical protein